MVSGRREKERERETDRDKHSETETDIIRKKKNDAGQEETDWQHA